MKRSSGQFSHQSHVQIRVTRTPFRAIAHRPGRPVRYYKQLLHYRADQLSGRRVYSLPIFNKLILLLSRFQREPRTLTLTPWRLTVFPDLAESLTMSIWILGPTSILFPLREDTPYFQKALNIVNHAPEGRQIINGL